MQSQNEHNLTDIQYLLVTQMYIVGNFSIMIVLICVGMGCWEIVLGGEFA